MALTPEYNLRPEFNKNYLINGDMAISQRGTSFAAIANTAYGLDRFQYVKVGAMVHTVTQDTDVPTFAQSGYLFQNSLRMNLTTPDTAIAAGDYCGIRQLVEGYNFAPLAQKVFTLSFWVKATLPGIYCVKFSNSISDRSIVYEYTINSSNTWEYKTITVLASPVAGTWDYINGVGLEVGWYLAVGSTFQTTAGTWQTGNFAATANQVNGVNTGATDFRITGAKLNMGPAAAPFSLSSNNYSTEFAACQRYYEKSYNYSTVPGTASAGGGLLSVSSGTAVGVVVWHIPYAVVKRALPTVVLYNPLTGAIGSCDRNSTPIAVTLASATQAQLGPNNSATTADNSAHSVHFTSSAELG